MQNEDERLLASTLLGSPGTSTAAGSFQLRQPLVGIAGRLRPYRDVRASFEPWRRVALRAWALREEAVPVN